MPGKQAVRIFYFGKPILLGVLKNFRGGKGILAMLKVFVTVCLLCSCLTMGLADGIEAVTWYDYDGHYYALIESLEGWQGAETIARGYGGHLATVNSNAENIWLINKFGPMVQRFVTPANLWIGLYQLEGAGEPRDGFVWSSGEDTEYRNWYPGEPNNDLGGNEKYVEMYTNAYWGQWNDVLEKEPSTGYFVRRYGIIEGNSAVPLPASLALLGVGLGRLVLYRRRKKNAGH